MSTSIDLKRTSGLINLGTHSFQVSKRSWEDMGPSGDICWYVVCEVISPGEDQGKELLHTLSHGQKSRWKMDEFLDGIDAPRQGKFSLEQCIGKKFRASVELGEYQGKPKSQLSAIIPSGDLQKSFDDLESETPELDSALPEDVFDDDDDDVAEEEKAPTRGRRKF